MADDIESFWEKLRPPRVPEPAPARNYGEELRKSIESQPMIGPLGDELDFAGPYEAPDPDPGQNARVIPTSELEDRALRGNRDPGVLDNINRSFQQLGDSARALGEGMRRLQGVVAPSESETNLNPTSRERMFDLFNRGRVDIGTILELLNIETTPEVINHLRTFARQPPGYAPEVNAVVDAMVASGNGSWAVGHDRVDESLLARGAALRGAYEALGYQCEIWIDPQLRLHVDLLNIPDRYVEVVPRPTGGEVIVGPPPSHTQAELDHLELTIREGLGLNGPTAVSTNTPIGSITDDITRSLRRLGTVRDVSLRDRTVSLMLENQTLVAIRF